MWPFSWFQKEKAPDAKQPVNVASTAHLLCGRFVEHLYAEVLSWNDKLPPEAKLSEEMVDALCEDLAAYFERWFLSGFPPLDERK